MLLGAHTHTIVYTGAEAEIRKVHRLISSSRYTPRLKRAKETTTQARDLPST